MNPHPTSPEPKSLPAVQALVEHVEGWLTSDQIARLHGAARAVEPNGRIVEIGSYRGRSTIVLASSAAPGVEIVAIDPHAGNDRGPQEIRGFEAEAAVDNVEFESNLRTAGIRDRVIHHRLYSDAAHELVDDPIDLLFIDGAHRFAPARADIHQWGRRVRQGGRMLIHDAFSSVGVTGAIFAELVPSREWRYVGRSGSLAEYRRVPLSWMARLRNASQQAFQLAWFVRNVLIKVLLVVGLGRVARALGHHQDAFPY